MDGWMDVVSWMARLAGRCFVSRYVSFRVLCFVSCYASFRFHASFRVMFRFVCCVSFRVAFRFVFMFRFGLCFVSFFLMFRFALCHLKVVVSFRVVLFIGFVTFVCIIRCFLDISWFGFVLYFINGFPPQKKQVKSEGVAVSHLESGGFVGSMAFNRFIKATPGAADDKKGGFDYHDGGMFRKGWEGFLHMLRKEGSVVGEVAKSVAGGKKRKQQDTSGMERSNNTITATSDVSLLMLLLLLLDLLALHVCGAPWCD